MNLNAIIISCFFSTGNFLLHISLRLLLGEFFAGSDRYDFVGDVDLSIFVSNNSNKVWMGRDYCI